MDTEAVDVPSKRCSLRLGAGGVGGLRTCYFKNLLYCTGLQTMTESLEVGEK